MGTLVAAYLLAWSAVTAYVAWLAVQNHRLAHRLDELETTVSDEDRSSQIDEGTEGRPLGDLRSEIFAQRSETRRSLTSDIR